MANANREKVSAFPIVRALREESSTGEQPSPILPEAPGGGRVVVLPLRIERGLRDGDRLFIEVSFGGFSRRERSSAGEGHALAICACRGVVRELGLRDEASAWGVRFGGTTAVLRDGSSVRSLISCLEEPWTEIAALQLVHAGNPPESAGSGEIDDRYSEPLDIRTTLGDAGPAIDDRARRAYRARLAELRHELEGASEGHDATRAARLRDEIDSLVHALSAAFGLGGRARRVASDVERARTAVTKRFSAVIRRIESIHAPLARHLATSVRTGRQCGYFPAPGERALVTRRPGGAARVPLPDEEARDAIESARFRGARDD